MNSQQPELMANVNNLFNYLNNVGPVQILQQPQQHNMNSSNSSTFDIIKSHSDYLPWEQKEDHQYKNQYQLFMERSDLRMNNSFSNENGQQLQDQIYSNITQPQEIQKSVQKQLDDNFNDDMQELDEIIQLSNTYTKTNITENVSIKKVEQEQDVKQKPIPIKKKAIKKILKKNKPKKIETDEDDDEYSNEISNNSNQKKKYRQSQHKNVYKNFGAALNKYIQQNEEFQQVICQQYNEEESKNFKNWVNNDIQLQRKEDFESGWTITNKDTKKIIKFKDMLKKLSRIFFEKHALLYLKNSPKIKQYNVHANSIPIFLKGIDHPANLKKFKPSSNLSQNNFIQNK